MAALKISVLLCGFYWVNFFLGEHNQHIKLSEMARLLSRSSKQFRRDVETYNIPCIKLGRTLLFDPERVNTYLYEQHVQSKTISPLEKPGQSRPIKSKKPAREELNNDSVERYKRLVGLE